MTALANLLVFKGQTKQLMNVHVLFQNRHYNQLIPLPAAKTFSPLFQFDLIRTAPINNIHVLAMTLIMIIIQPTILMSLAAYELGKKTFKTENPVRNNL